MAGSLAVSTANALPSGWGYELISPADTLGSDLASGLASTSGDRAWFTSSVPLAGNQFSGNAVVFEATRTASGWQSRDLGEPGNDWFVLLGRSEDATAKILEVCEGSLLNCLPGEYKLVKIDGSGNRTTMFSMALPKRRPLPSLVGVSPDASDIYLRNPGTEAPLLSDDTHTAGAGLYMSHEGTLSFIGTDEHGDVVPCGAVLANDNSNLAGIGTGFKQDGISEDGRTVAYEAPDPAAGCSDPTDVYVRSNGTTIDVSKPRDGSADTGARFIGASNDGSLTFFVTANGLVTDDLDGTADIYVYDGGTQEVRRLTAGVGVDEGQAAVSPEGDFVYFVSSRADPAAGGVTGQPNLYVYHAGAVRLIASATTGTPLLGGSALSSSPTSITPDGTHLLFLSTDALGTGMKTGEQAQLFQYSYTNDELDCVSCPPDGSVPPLDTGFPSAPPVGNDDQRFQSDDGDTIAFDTRNALLPQDLNGTGRDVYLWRRGKPLSLISTGVSPSDSQMYGLTGEGSAVFFTSADRLVAGISQSNKKFYVARLGGGFAPPGADVRCAEDACQGSPTSPPTFAAPISQTLVGPGNLKPGDSRGSSKPSSKSQKLKKALKACRSHHKKSQRKKCESAADRRFGKAGGSK